MIFLKEVISIVNTYINRDGKIFFLDNALTPEAEDLNKFLGRYTKLKKHRDILESNRQQILKDFDSPLSAIVYDGMPKGIGNISNGAASLSLKLSDIESKIDSCKDKMLQQMELIIKICSLLPLESQERSVLEKRYITGNSWQKISEEFFYSKAGTIIFWKRGLYMLLEFEKVREIVAEFGKLEKLRRMGLVE